MEWIIITILSILLIFAVGILLWGFKRVEDKIKFYENNSATMAKYIINIRNMANDAYQMMKEADIRGSFESDDEVGDVFKLMKQIVEKVDDYINIEEKDVTIS